ncbi:ATPase inhibitor IATP mitochondria [Penicillium soppii]|uniref:ATPase inhibitor IATP mitochondria n=1 Tax=Penicillium soppii TaxID=69789 RepID=UPI0025499D6B|nr:ATPase inhibitor IATP mitochondria [Penicillium soppii]KAJ5861302.1 ATPase inhibitor IATP mitochondria [Penicillium soppii]
MQSALPRPILRITTNPALLRSFSVAPTAMAAGDLGSTKPRGFMAEKDSFTKREAAHEAMYIKKLEMEKIERLRQKLQEQRKHMDELDKHLDEYTKNQGGELN